GDGRALDVTLAIATLGLDAQPDDADAEPDRAENAVAGLEVGLRRVRAPWLRKKRAARRRDIEPALRPGLARDQPAKNARQQAEPPRTVHDRCPLLEPTSAGALRVVRIGHSPIGAGSCTPQLPFVAVTLLL